MQQRIAHTRFREDRALESPLERISADSDLRDLWRAYARRMSDTGLALCVAMSVLLIVAFAVIALMHARWALRWWPAVLPPMFAAGFGAWGIADRELTDRRRGEGRPLAVRLLVAVEWAACIAAALAVAAGTLVFLRVTVGTWIS